MGVMRGINQAVSGGNGSVKQVEKKGVRSKKNSHKRENTKKICFLSFFPHSEEFTSFFCYAARKIYERKHVRAYNLMAFLTPWPLNCFWRAGYFHARIFEGAVILVSPLNKRVSGKQNDLLCFWNVCI